MECGEKRMPSSFGTLSQVGHCIQPGPPGARAAAERPASRQQQGAPLTRGRRRHTPASQGPGTFPRPGTHSPGLCSPSVGPAARRPVHTRPGSGSGVKSAGGVSRPWARRAGSQEPLASSAPCMARTAPPAAQHRPPAALLPPARLQQPKPAAPAGSSPSRRARGAGRTARSTPPGPARSARATA